MRLTLLLSFYAISMAVCFPVHGMAIWQCTYKPDDGSAGGWEKTFRYEEVDRENFLGYVDDFSGLPLNYRIIEQSKSGILAVNHSLRPQEDGSLYPHAIFVALNKESGAFRLTSIDVGTFYEERQSGVCLQTK